MHVKSVHLDELLETADVVSLHVPDVPSTRNFFKKNSLQNERRFDLH